MKHLEHLENIKTQAQNNLNTHNTSMKRPRSQLPPLTNGVTSNGITLKNNSNLYEKPQFDTNITAHDRGQRSRAKNVYFSPAIDSNDNDFVTDGVTPNGTTLKNYSNLYVTQQFNTDSTHDRGQRSRMKNVYFSPAIDSNDNDFATNMLHRNRELRTNNQNKMIVKSQQISHRSVSFQSSTNAILVNSSSTKPSSLQTSTFDMFKDSMNLTSHSQNKVIAQTQQTAHRKRVTLPNSKNAITVDVTSRKPSSLDISQQKGSYTFQPVNDSVSNIGSCRQERVLFSLENAYTQPDYHKPSILNVRKGNRNVELKQENYYTGEPPELDPRLINTFPVGSERVAVEKLESVKNVTQNKNQPLPRLERHMKIVDDFANNIPHKLNMQFGSSSVFQTVMIDMYGNLENRKSRCFTKPNSVNISLYATKFLGKVKAHKKLKNVENSAQNKYSSIKNIYMASQDNDKNTKSGWRILRNYFQKMNGHKTHASNAVKNWFSLRKTPDSLNIFDHMRRDLYQRYGIIPFINSDGTIVQENMMLSERARSLLPSLSRNYKRSQIQHSTKT